MNETVMLIRVNNYATSYIFGLSGVNYQGCVTKFNINIADVDVYTVIVRCKKRGLCLCDFSQWSE